MPKLKNVSLKQVDARLWERAHKASDKAKVSMGEWISDAIREKLDRKKGETNAI